MFQRTILTAALITCASAYIYAAERATFILTDGERKGGIVAFHGGQSENLINGHLNLAQDNARDLTFPADQVAVIDFTGGEPLATELAQLGAGQMLVLRDGTSQEGRFVNMVGGETLLWDKRPCCGITRPASTSVLAFAT
jgi:hypothetical protein